MSLTPDVVPAVEVCIESYIAAAAAKDVDSFMRLYDPQVRIFDTWGAWSYEGADAWRKMIAGWFSSLGSGHVTVTFNEVRTRAAGALTVMTAFVAYCGRSAQNEVLNAMQNRMTWVLQDTGSGLQIIHEHTSVPVRFEDAKAILLPEAGAQGTSNR
jgi:ketosteroid isomerase-like protein